MDRSIYYVASDQLEDFHESGDLETVKDFTDIIEQMHYMIEDAANDYIYDYNRKDFEEDYLPMI